MEYKKLSEIHIRDPYIYVDEKSGFYYMYGTTGSEFSPDHMGFMCYRSRNLTDWEGPFDAYNSGQDGIDFKYQDYWAPEVYHYNDRFYMFATLGPKNEYRRCLVLTAEKPEGPFAIVGQLTPEGWNCLDASLAIEDGQPYAVFCREWLEVGDGEMYLVPLKDDLTGPCGEPKLLFTASEYPKCFELTWENTIKGYVTDGPNVFRSVNDELFMLWSTFTTHTGSDKYVLAYCKSASGRLEGPWKQIDPPLEVEDGGHGMVFRDFQGELHYILHSPNTDTLERPVIYSLDDTEPGRLSARMNGNERVTIK